MSLRTAMFRDTPRLVELLQEMHQRSVYAEVDKVDVQEAKQLLVSAMQRTEVHGQGGACVFVVERSGTVEGFIVGMLDRIYGIGQRLMATDVFFYTSPRASRRDFVALFNAFEGWALGNPKVIEIKPGVTDAIIADPERLARFYERRGYRRCGIMCKRMLER